MATWTTMADQVYYIYVRGASGETPDSGLFELSIEQQDLEVANDFCGTSENLSIPSGVFGTTEAATTDDLEENVDTCGLGNIDSKAPGVWYSVLGQGATLTASLCDGTDYDTLLFVYKGSCTSLECVAANDDSCKAQSSVSWEALDGERYYILVSGYSGAVGAFQLTLQEAA